MREIAQRADPQHLPDPRYNPHSPAGARGDSWPRWVQLALFGCLFIGVGAAAVFLGLERWRRATFVFGLTVVYLGVLRQYLPDTMLGIFSVRSRTFDLLFCLALGGLMVFLSASVDALGS
ncbi:DUF3017 domain-containing protein [Corynebacterium sp. TAE3-ERU12]|uniref:DUF3017 domain-containing protein n=1 Tax=Corynebacterium sp. TAE3-ERU12 TaxID=2849491 RepID=UPI001C48FB07|nr:DUF3017 domain-containing protein [Corynebacterium sp. TAE3-ERU12]MBV7294747.1 DUF3017 domain-containing protein [Corynebacterium sp. TAE3-ERU12]